MRLTKRHELKGMVGYTYKDINIDGYTTIGEPIIKLGQLEDIEDELGIDLITLFKALKNGIWFKNIVDNKVRWSIPMFAELEISKKGLTLISMEMDILFYFKDYGKTWALTKEELL